MQEHQNPHNPVYLTVDDGPNPDWTPAILDTLRDHRALATFFVCGVNVERYPEIAKRIVADGHAIGNHTYSHSFMKTCLGLVETEIERTTDLVSETTGVRPTLLRFPWGLRMPWVRRRAFLDAYRVYRWSIDSRDWMGYSADSIFDRVTARVHAGSIVLMHDGKEAHDRANRSQTARALPKLLGWLGDHEYQCTSLPD